MASNWKKTITTPFRKAATFFNHHQQQQPPCRDKNPPQPPGKEISRVTLDLQGEVMACAYEDVQVMWSILDKSKSSSTCNITSS